MDPENPRTSARIKGEEHWISRADILRVAEERRLYLDIHAKAKRQRSITDGGIIRASL